MKFQKFVKKHGGLKANVFRRDAPWSGSLFGSNQEEREYIGKQSADKVWTLICENRDYFLIPGDIDTPSKLGNIVTKKISTEKIQIT